MEKKLEAPGLSVEFGGPTVGLVVPTNATAVHRVTFKGAEDALAARKQLAREAFDAGVDMDRHYDNEYSLHETRERAIAAAKEWEEANDKHDWTEEQIPEWEYSSRTDSDEGPMVHVEAIHVEAP